MTLTQTILMRTFGRPQGTLGRLGGAIMARMNASFGAWVTELLKVTPEDRVLDVGFGPGVVLQRLSELAPAGHVAGIDPSPEMVVEARARNRAAIQSGRVEVLLGSVDDLPFVDASLDKALSINSMQVWPDAQAGLREMRRVIRPSGPIALGFTRHSVQPVSGVTEKLIAAGFAYAYVTESDMGFCTLARRSEN